MHRVLTPGRTSARTRVVAIGAGVVALMGLAACTSAATDSPSGQGAVGKGGSDGPGSASSSSAAPALAAAITSLPAAGAKGVDPAQPFVVKVAHGKLSAVTMTNPHGKKVTGAMSSDGTSWKTTEDLGYSKTYTVSATAKNADGVATVKREKVATVDPNNMTMPYINDIYGNSVNNGATYGVGMVVSMHFDESIPNKKKAEQALQVTTSPHVDGAWYWTDDSTAHWRPQHYYQPGTKVTVAANVYGHAFGDGLYGESDVSKHFVIGQKRYSVANAKTHQVKVYFDDKLKRTMPTSMGQGGTTQGENGPIYLWTMPGIYTVINHENPAIMSSDSYGLPSSSPLGYGKEAIPYGTKISTDGIYLHELDTTVWAQGNTNVSHGCLNLNYSNAKWFYNHSRVGDVVQVVHSGGPKIQVWQGGDWSVPWSEWSKGNL